MCDVSADFVQMAIVIERLYILVSVVSAVVPLTYNLSPRQRIDRLH